MQKRKLISIISPCYNEEENVVELFERVRDIMVSRLPNYDFEYVFIDNASSDTTVEKLRALAERDRRLKVIVNTRNFGHIRSPYWGIIQTSGDATVYLASDFQDPPEMIPDFVREWETGTKIVLAVKPVSQSNPFMHALRRLYYSFLDRIAEVEIVRDSTGFGLYDKVVIDQVRSIEDPYPFLRGLISELGHSIKTIPFNQPRRLRGLSKNNFYTLYDIAWLGLISHSLVPIRIASMLGFFIGGLSFLVAVIFFFLKLAWWDRFPLGIAPIVIGMFMMFGLILVFIGILGEYIGSIHTYAQKRPIVVEKERINFE